MNVVESEETTTWYVEKDKSWNLAAAIWYVKMDECCWKWRNKHVEKDKSWNLAAAIWYVKRMNVVGSEETTWKKDKSWNLAAAIWYVKKDECCWKSEETTTWYVEKDESWN